MAKPACAGVKLSEEATQLIVALCRTGFIEGEKLLGSVSNPTRKCETLFRLGVVEALEELTQHGLAEPQVCGSRNTTTVCCMPPLRREYRLTNAGFNWRLQNGIRFGNGIAIRGH
ncbi:MAG: hypothetical protein KBD06_02880 [Candidatus Pacebacteria bacterium]|nr:hypothetical protein [Candidatus Paceibacterota bacterium]